MVGKKIPEYLKLHVEESAEGANFSDASRSSGNQEFPDLCSAFRDATGWSLHIGLARRQVDASSADGEPAGTCSFRLVPGGTENGTATLERPKAQRLAASLAHVLSELDRARDAVWRREADLAAGVPVTSDERAEEHLAARLEAVLKGGAQAVGCQAAGVYLLDDATTELKLRACWGLPKHRLLAAARPLRGAMADLEALVGHAVVLEDTSLLPQWKVPESCAAAVCVPISSPTEPLGTLWMLCDHPRDFTAEQTNLVEIIAGRVAAELQREMLMRECVQTKRVDRQLARAVQWQDDRLPSIPPLLPGWELAGSIGPHEVLCGGFYDWFVPPSGQLAVAVAMAEGTPIEAALTAASLHGALRAQANDPHSASAMARCLNETMWNSSAGGQVASFCYAMIDPDSGQVECLCSGSVTGIVLARDGAVRIPAQHPPLGMQPGERFAPLNCQLDHGDLLVLFAGCGAHGVSEKQPSSGDPKLVEQLTGRHFSSPHELLDHIGKLTTGTQERAAHAPAMLAVQRKPA